MTARKQNGREGLDALFAKRRRIDAQIDRVIEVLGLIPDDMVVMADYSYGVMLTPDQLDALLAKVVSA
jgi:hypothetical protein